MYYCISCGVVVYENRPDSKSKMNKPFLSKRCAVCGNSKGFRKVLPEFFRSAHLDEFNRFREMVFEILEIEEDKAELDNEKEE